MALLLKIGSEGSEVTDLNSRLVSLGYLDKSHLNKTFSLDTHDALIKFQTERGVVPDGICGPETWAAIVEASWVLGSRPLYLRHPMLRGDDVAELQRKLNTLGFNAGRLDGIFGNNTVTALREFQMNVGLNPDGIFGHRTFQNLNNVLPRHEVKDLIIDVKEKVMELNNHTLMENLRIGLGDCGSSPSFLSSLSRKLIALGIKCETLTNIDQSSQASEANLLDVDICMVFQLVSPHESNSILYYHGYQYISEPAKRLAMLFQTNLENQFENIILNGMALPILRETKMPSIFLKLGPTSKMLKSIDLISQSIYKVMVDWTKS